MTDNWKEINEWEYTHYGAWIKRVFINQNHVIDPLTHNITRTMILVDHNCRSFLKKETYITRENIEDFLPQHIIDTVLDTNQAKYYKNTEIDWESLSQEETVIHEFPLSPIEREFLK